MYLLDEIKMAERWRWLGLVWYYHELFRLFVSSLSLSVSLLFFTNSATIYFFQERKNEVNIKDPKLLYLRERLINFILYRVTCFSIQMRFRIEALESTAGFYQKTPRKYNCITFHKASHKVFDFKDDLNLFAVYSCEESIMNIRKQTG